MRLCGPCFLFIVALFSVAPGFAIAAEPVPDFGRDITPTSRSIARNVMALRSSFLVTASDVRAGAMAGGESGEAAIVAGKPDASPLVARITSDDKDVRMPPAGERLSAREVELVRAWIGAGAPWPDELAGDDKVKKTHWAFVAPVRPELPATETAKAVQNPIDRFIVARLDAEKLSLSPEADGTTLLRRLSLDLTGLPPTIAEVDAFLADTSKGSLRAGRRTIAGVAALRRTLGSALARRCSLRGQRWLRKR